MILLMLWRLWRLNNRHAEEILSSDRHFEPQLDAVKRLHQELFAGIKIKDFEPGQMRRCIKGDLAVKALTVQGETYYAMRSQLDDPALEQAQDILSAFNVTHLKERSTKKQRPR